MYFGIKQAVRLVNTDPDLATLIITGTGDVFAPGGDLGGRRDPGDRDVSASRHRHPPVSRHQGQSGTGGGGRERDLSGGRVAHRHDGGRGGGERARHLPGA